MTVWKRCHASITFPSVYKSPPHGFSSTSRRSRPNRANAYRLAENGRHPGMTIGFDRELDYDQTMLNEQTCWNAMKHRDASYDGVFFVGVRTTGVYCRPVCRARMPKRENVLFYLSAAAAERAGYRPCLRCRPETAPFSPAWNGSITTVRRALTLIEEGALDHGTVESLADRLGIGSRHLSRLFERHLGASPKAVANTRRVQHAKRLVTDTKLPLADVACAAGFQSIRAFNAAFLKAYRKPPSAFR